MELGLAIHRYFPTGGLQRDCLRLLEALRGRGHRCRVYCASWEGAPPAGVELRRLPFRGLGNHDRDRRFQAALRADLQQRPVDALIGFTPMPGLDFHFAGDDCYLQTALEGRGRWYRLTPRFRHRSAMERAVFGAGAATHVLLLSERQRSGFARHYATEPQRLHLLPPGVAVERGCAGTTAAQRRAARAKLRLTEGEFALLFVASAFDTKGLDRALAALATLCRRLPSQAVRLLVAGRDRPGRFKRLARRLGVARHVEYLGPRDDIADLMRAADLLLHPARREAGGVVLLEALAAGLPVLTTAACGYAEHVQRGRAGIVLPEPFDQEALDRALLRCVDGVFRADCRESGQRYARRLDLHGMHGHAAALIESLLAARGGAADAGA